MVVVCERVKEWGVGPCWAGAFVPFVTDGLEFEGDRKAMDEVYCLRGGGTTVCQWNRQRGTKERYSTATVEVGFNGLTCG